MNERFANIRSTDQEIHTLTLTVVPNATSNLHSDPLDKLTWVGGGGA